MRFQGARLFAFLSVLSAAPAGNADDIAVPAQADFSVLTPSMEENFIAGKSDALGYLPYVGGFASLNTSANSKRFRQFAAAQRHDPARTIADRMIDALGEAGYTAIYEPIPRKPAGSVQSLSWSDLPEQPKGKLFLDLNIRWICLCTGSDYFRYRPAISIGWRLLDHRQNVVEPTRNLLYVHAPPWNAGKKPAMRSATAPEAVALYPPVEVSETCGFDDIDEAQKDPLRLWGCFGEAYDVAVDRLVIDLKRLRPPAAPVTVSADNPS